MTTMPTTHQQELLTQALRLRAGGLSLIPINGATKQPYSELLPRYCPYPEQLSRDNIAGAPTWRPFQTAAADAIEIARWIKHGAQIALATGYAGLTILDFDEPEFFARYVAQLGQAALCLPAQMTGGGGYQMAFRSPRPERNQKLAYAPDASKLDGRSIAIETRGLHGYAIVYPSLHPSGRVYRPLWGDFAAIPMISQALADHLLAMARSLCQVPQPLNRPAPTPRPTTPSLPLRGQSPIQLFNQAHPIDGILHGCGYQHCHQNRWAPPGADRQRDSVVVDLNRQKAYHHDTDYPLADGYWHDAFDIWAYYQHGGDTRAAVRAASALFCLEYSYAA